MNGRFKALASTRAAVEADEPPAKPTAKAEPTAKAASSGRPPGKRSDKINYQSVTTFLHKQTYQDAQRALIGSEQDFGDLVDELLRDWLNRQAK